MKCPKCNNGEAKYLNRKRISLPSKKKSGKARSKEITTNNIGKCKKCGYEGEI